MSTPHALVIGGCLAAAPLAQAIEIQLDYSYDTNGFFDQPGAKEALRAVADYYEELLTDDLAAIVPGGGNSWTAFTSNPATGGDLDIDNLVVPEDTVVVYVGGRDMSTSESSGPLGRGGPGGYSVSGSQAFVDAVAGRGQPGAGNQNSSFDTDFGPWGGALSFNSHYNWNFDVDERTDDFGFDFVATALHEFGHLFGVGTAAFWDNQINPSGEFAGSFSVASFGGNVPVQPGGAHWQNDGACEPPLGYDPDNPLNVLSRTYGSFGADHGVNQIARMDPQTCPYYRDSILVMTDLDLAGLRDIGWEIDVPVRSEVVELGPGQTTLDWLSSTGETIYLQRTTDLAQGWSDVGGGVAGDGSVLSLSDPASPDGKAFYRLSETSASVILLSGAAFSAQPSEPKVPATSRQPRMVDSCAACVH